MKAMMRHLWPEALLAVLLGSLVALTLHPYAGNPSALFHMDRPMVSSLGVPSNFVVLTVPGYDGMQYFEIARRLPLLFSKNGWLEVATTPTIAYSYQRLLLPTLAFALAAGRDAWLPWSFLAINLGSLLLAGWWMLRSAIKPLYVFALALCPAATIGLHFSLAEPLTLGLLTAFLLRFERRHRMYTIDTVLLALLVLTREVNILFIGVLLLFFLAKKRWSEAMLMSIPIAAFLALHSLIYAIFHEIPFLWSTGKHALPFSAVATLLTGGYGFNRLTLTSIALVLVFILPTLVWLLLDLWKRRSVEFLPVASLAFIGVMMLLPDHIWGSITSIGRVITPIYPLVLLYAAKRDTLLPRLIATALLLLGLGIGVALAVITHPHTFS
jgi:hypothetical protein